MRDLQIEFLKHKRRGILLVLGALWGIQTVYLFYGTYNMKDVSQGWIMQLYQLPLLNGIMMPTVVAVMSSRLIDIEHKGNSWKYLETIQKKEQIFDSKMLCGFGYLFIFCIMQLVSAVMSGIVLDYGENPDVWAYLLYFIETLVISFTVFLLQMIISIRVPNQMVALSVGLCGSMIGLFLMFLPQLPWLDRVIIWGNYGSTMFVGINWDKITQISEFYYMDVDKSALISVLIWFGILYFVGKKMIRSMEV